MVHTAFVNELRQDWFPHVTDSGLDRMIDLLAKGSPMLIRGAFTRAPAQGCLATHFAWNHPRTECLNGEAGITWLTRIAGMNPATSYVINAWDDPCESEWDLRMTLLTECAAERTRRNDDLERIHNSTYELVS